MEVKNFQNKITEFVSAWDKKRNVSPNEQLVLNHIVEEIGELAREYVNKESRKERFSEKELNNAIGDTIMQLIELASLRNLDIENLILEIIDEEQKALRK